MEFAMNDAFDALCDDELDYAIDYRDQESPTSNRVFVSRTVNQSSRQKQMRASRYGRQRRPALNGIHRRGNRAITR
jgi:hypothetical protein